MKPMTGPSQYMDLSPYFDGIKARKLLLQFCQDTGRYQYYPRPGSVYTGKRNLVWREASGRGTLVSWTTVTVPSTGNAADAQSRICAFIDLEEGVRILSWLDPSAHDSELHVGQPMAIASWMPMSDGINWPVFGPVRTNTQSDCANSLMIS